jgi:hypothetical protein
MTRRGRKPTGAQLVERLDGSEHAKGRLKVILETLSGHKTIPQACEELGIQESMFHKMRAQVLQTAVDRLEPRPAGRKPQLTSAESRRIEELEAELMQTRMDLKTTDIRRELAEALPRLGRRRESPGAKSDAEQVAATAPVAQAAPTSPPADGPGKKTTRGRPATRRRNKKRRK